MATTAQSVADVCAEARDAARELARLDSATKDAALHAMADALEQRSAEILDGNARDMEAGQDAGLHAGLLDRLKLDDGRLANIARDVRAIAALPDPVGETIDGHRLDNGFGVRRVRGALRGLFDNIVQEDAFKEALRKEPQVLGVTQTTDTAQVIRVVAETKPTQRLTIERLLRERITAAIAESGIRIPPVPTLPTTSAPGL